MISPTIHFCNQFITRRKVPDLFLLLPQLVTVVVVFTWLPSVHTKRRSAGTTKRKATWTGCAVPRLTLSQRVTHQPLVPHQIRSLPRGHTTSKSSQNKRITLVGTNTVSIPFKMNILLHSLSPFTSMTPQSRWKLIPELQFPSSMRPPSNNYSSPHAPPPWNQPTAS